MATGGQPSSPISSKSQQKKAAIFHEHWFSSERRVQDSGGENEPKKTFLVGTRALAVKSSDQGRQIPEGLIGPFNREGGGNGPEKFFWSERGAQFWEGLIGPKRNYFLFIVCFLYLFAGPE